MCSDRGVGGGRALVEGWKIVARTNLNMQSMCKQVERWNDGSGGGESKLVKPKYHRWCWLVQNSRGRPV